MTDVTLNKLKQRQGRYWQYLERISKVIYSREKRLQENGMAKIESKVEGVVGEDKVL